MNWKPDVASKVPFYRQIADHFEQLILQGDLQPGTVLPTERVLAAQLGVNRSTVSTAYAELRSSGLISSTQGSGTRVSEDLWNVAPQKIINWNHFTGVSFLPIHPIRKRIREAAGLPGMIDLATASMAEELYPLQPMKEILQQISASPMLGYSELTGDRSLREVLSVHLREHYGIFADPDEILITSGSQQASLLLTHGLLRPGDAVAIECPSYTYRLNFFSTAGVRMLPLPLDEGGLDPEHILTLHKKCRIRMVFTNPTNQDPTGTTLDEARRKRLLHICEDLRLPIIEIDFTRPLTHPGKPSPPKTLYELSNNSGIVIHSGSLSDTVAPGIRVGWVVGSKAVIGRLAETKHQMDKGTPSISQQIALHFLRSGYWQNNVSILRQKLGERRKIMEDGLRQHLGDTISWNVPNGGGYLWCQLSHQQHDRDFLESGIQHGVLFDPGSIYGVGHGFARLCYSHCPEEMIAEGIRRLAAALHS